MPFLFHVWPYESKHFSSFGVSDSKLVVPSNCFIVQMLRESPPSAQVLQVSSVWDRVSGGQEARPEEVSETCQEIDFECMRVKVSTPEGVGRLFCVCVYVLICSLSALSYGYSSWGGSVNWSANLSDAWRVTSSSQWIRDLHKTPLMYLRTELKPLCFKWTFKSLFLFKKKIWIKIAPIGTNNYQVIDLYRPGFTELSTKIFFIPWWHGMSKCMFFLFSLIMQKS